MPELGALVVGCKTGEKTRCLPFLVCLGVLKMESGFFLEMMDLWFEHFWGPGKLHLGMTKTTWDVSKLVGVRWDKSRRPQVVQDCWATGWQKIWDKPSLCQASCYLTSLVVGPYLCTCLDGAGGAEGTTRRSQVLKWERWDWSGLWGIYLHVVDFTSKL